MALTVTDGISQLLHDVLQVIHAVYAEDIVVHGEAGDVSQVVGLFECTYGHWYHVDAFLSGLQGLVLGVGWVHWVLPVSNGDPDIWDAISVTCGQSPTSFYTKISPLIGPDVRQRQLSGLWYTFAFRIFHLKCIFKQILLHNFHCE